MTGDVPSTSVAEYPLISDWEFRFDTETTWQPIPVPGCWEMLDVPKDNPGPAWYRTRVMVPLDWAGRRHWLRFGAVSYHAVIVVNGHEIGFHTGLWDAFSVEITGRAMPGTTAELLVKIEKPASLTGGPDTPSVPGSFPIRQTLAGFLPYVGGHIFGGIWQDVHLVATGDIVFTDAHIRGRHDGRVDITASLSSPADVAIKIVGPGGDVLARETRHGEPSMRFSTRLPNPQPWSPGQPTLYTARLWIANGDTRTIRFGLRSLRADGATILLNDRPVFPRLALSWGWYPASLHSNPGPERVRADFAHLRDLGYNGVKLCLWFSPSYYFDLADEFGMLLWVELPMWLPDPTPAFRQQTPIEYERLVRAARDHPAVFCYSLGCELGRAVDAELLGPLYRLVTDLAGDALVRDNSGSGEAFGGLLDEHADYYDYHFYSDLPFLRSLLDTFAPRWRPEQPWLFGEFCDADTFRDLRRFPADDSEPCWLSADPDRNPQGARWQFDIVEQETRLRANGMWERGAELQAISERQALLHRKWTLELVRTYREIAGYVVTGEVDTPISTAGMWDEMDRLKFDPDRFRAFNDDLVLLVGWDKRRAWVAGGDRAAPWDTTSFTVGERIRPHLIVSHYGNATAPAEVAWSAAFPGESPFATGANTTTASIAPGTVREVAIAAFEAPPVSSPRRLTFRAKVRIGDETSGNAWPLWVFPPVDWNRWPNLNLTDPTGRLADIVRLAPALADIVRLAPALAESQLSPSSVVLTTRWTPRIAEHVESGGAALLLQPGSGPAGPLVAEAMPFWREAIRLVEPHPAWSNFPTGDFAGLQFFGCATDHALAIDGHVVTPILRRLDVRTMHIHDYATEITVGTGHLIVTTLRFEGGPGEQPLGLQRNTAAAYLLACFLRYLHTVGPS